MKAHSLDLQQKVVERHEAVAIMQRELARQFGIGAFLVVRALRLRRRRRIVSGKTERR